MAEHVVNVLFVCNTNSTRGILAESILNHMGTGRFRAFSAGYFPSGNLNTFAVELLEKQRFPTCELRSKGLDEFARPDAPRLDLVLTVCDDSEEEAGTVWPGQPVVAHWGVGDPAAVRGVNQARRYAIVAAFRLLRRRIGMLVALPIGQLEAFPLERRLNAIGQIQ